MAAAATPPRGVAAVASGEERQGQGENCGPGVDILKHLIIIVADVSKQ